MDSKFEKSLLTKEEREAIDQLFVVDELGSKSKEDKIVYSKTLAYLESLPKVNIIGIVVESLLHLVLNSGKIVTDENLLDAANQLHKSHLDLQKVK